MPPTRSRTRPSLEKRKSLQGLRVLVSRAREQAEGLSSELRDLGAVVIEIPFIEIRRPRSYKPLDEALRRLGEYDWLVLTSVNGVKALWERLARLKLTNHCVEHLQVAAIGPATKHAIEKRGMHVDVMPEEYVAESVVKRLRNKIRGKRVLLVRAKVARDVIPKELRAAGAKVDVVEAYETVVPRISRQRLLSALHRAPNRPDVITFTSSSTVRNFAAMLSRQNPDQLLDGVRLASIGPVTSATLRELGLPVDIEAKKFTMSGLVKAIRKSERNRQSRVGGE
jgi:uroporphyrinogen-III synthase